MSDKHKKKETFEKQEEGSINIDLGLGKIFKGLGNFVDTLSDMTEKGEEFREKVKDFQGKGSMKDVKGVYGFSIRTGLGGQPKVEPFGNVKSTPKGPVVEKSREPIVDIFEEDDTIQIIAEIPGVDDDMVKLDISGDILILTAESSIRNYAKEILLPSEVEIEPLSRSYANGIFDVKFKKK